MDDCQKLLFCAVLCRPNQARSQGGGQGGPCPPAKPECPPLEQKYYISFSGTVKKVKFHANVLNFACVSQQL